MSRLINTKFELIVEKKFVKKSRNFVSFTYNPCSNVRARTVEILVGDMFRHVFASTGDVILLVEF